MPLVIVFIMAVLLDVIFRLGYWNDFIKPKSYLGNAIYREKAIKDFGLENIHWITIGDSRFDWGIEHSRIKNTQKRNGLNHLRMSFESSNFMAIQTTIEWSIANMPNLKGILIGVSEDGFSHYSAATNQYKVAWPFRSFIKYNKYQYFDFKSHLYSYFTRYGMSVYFNDLRFFLRNIVKRFKDINDFINNDFHNIFEFNRNMQGNICQYQLDDLKDCILTAKELHKKKTKLKGAENFIYKVCYNSQSSTLPNEKFIPTQLSSQEKEDLSNQWVSLFSIINQKNIELKLVYLPDHDIFDYAIKSNNAHEVSNKIINHVGMLKNTEILDLSKEFKTKNKFQSCQLYKDPLHFNNIGKSLITEKIINRFFLTVSK